jgi:hypothetical protein
VKTGLNRLGYLLVVALSFGVTGSMARGAARTSPQDHAEEQDYSKTKTYQQGLREGRDDREHNRDHSKKHHFKKDEDQKAYEAGYQAGHQADQSDHR